VRFSRILEVPKGADRLTIRCTLRWTARGRVDWHVPRIEPASAPDHASREVRIAVVTGRVGGRPKVTCVQDNVAFYADLCRQVCREENVDLIAMPEIALNWGVGSALDTALPVPGPETDVFAEIAERHGVHIAIGMYERNDDACHNSLILVGPDREIEARYRKVHLAWDGENVSGLLPGDSFPVADTDIGRIGFNICMDSSAADSAHMVGLNGADFLVLAIMGDHRADRWSSGSPIFNTSRWLAIQRTRAMDNQLCMVIARNTAIGSCIIDRKGDILTWNEGDRDWISATVNVRDGYRYWNGGCFRDVNWAQRRPHLYAQYVDTANYGSLG
jgi:predicted amidohydrolase